MQAQIANLFGAYYISFILATAHPPRPPPSPSTRGVPPGDSEAEACSRSVPRASCKFKKMMFAIGVARAAVRQRAVVGAVAGVAPKRKYHEKDISHHEWPRNRTCTSVRSRVTHVVISGEVWIDRCDSVMKPQIRVDEHGIISDVKFKTFGCGSAIASSWYMTERVKGLSLDEAGQIKNTEIARELSLPPVELYCSMLAEDAIRSAIRDYRSKRSKMVNPQKPGFIDVSQSAATGETVSTTRPGQA
ncbi:iron-binding protein [Ceratobasidium sp. 395]|nr:iron-binding protein [Ceratobasidium sp. 395]